MIVVLSAVYTAWLGYVLGHDNLICDIPEWKMLCKATWGRKRMELLHDVMEGRDYGQLKNLISDRSRWRQDSKWECVSETCWKQQQTKEVHGYLQCRLCDKNASLRQRSGSNQILLIQCSPGQDGPVPGTCRMCCLTTVYTSDQPTMELDQ